MIHHGLEYVKEEMHFDPIDKIAYNISGTLWELYKQYVGSADSVKAIEPNSLNRLESSIRQELQHQINKSNKSLAEEVKEDLIIFKNAKSRLKSNPKIDGEKRLAKIIVENPHKSLREMTAGELNKEYEKYRKISSDLTTQFIKEGRGNERPSETFHKTDPLSQKYIAVSDKLSDLHNELERRFGPDVRFPIPANLGRMRRKF